MSTLRPPQHFDAPLTSDLSRTPPLMQFPPKRAMASFDNLVALANYEEHLKEARKIVWRDRGETPADITDLWQCLEHAGKGGTRAATLAFAIRAGVNLILLMTRIKRVPRNYRLTLIRHAIFGLDSFRFAAMLGSFVGLYKFILNALPIVIPEPVSPRSRSKSRSRSLLRSSRPPRPSHPSQLNSPFEDDDEIDLENAAPTILPTPRNSRLSVSAQAHQVWLHKRTRRWYAIAAGALAGSLAILWEKRSRRVAIGQQMFVRGLQGSFNAFSGKYGVKIPHGDVLVFSLCCGQIMYAWFCRPDTLPRSYDMWISTASKVHKEAVSIQRGLLRDGVFSVKDMETLVAKEDTTPANRAILLARIAAATAPSPEQTFGPRFVPCAAEHPWADSCTTEQLLRFGAVFRWMLPIYGALHVIPMLLFRRNRVWKEPLKMLSRAGWGSMRSAAFLGVFVFIYQSFFCIKHNLFEILSGMRAAPASNPFRPLLHFLRSALNLSPSSPVLQPLIHRYSYYVLGLLSGLSLFVEEKRRREELAMYVLPKGLESAWVMARGKGWVGKTGRWGEVLLTGVGMGMVMDIYQNDPQHLSGLVRRILYQFVGPN